MKKTHDQAAFYRLLARLLWYLASGKSHVGYLSNCPRNPFVAKDARVIHDCVVVRSVPEMVDSDEREGDGMESGDLTMDDDDDDDDGDRIDERMEGLIMSSY